MAVLDGGRIVPALDLDEPRLLDRLGIAACADAAVAEHIAREFLVQLRCAVAHRLLRIEDEGQLLVLYLYLAESLLCRKLVRRDDDCNVVAPESDVVGEQQSVGYVLVFNVRRPGVARGGKVVFRHVEAGEDRLHSLGSQGLFGVYALYQRVGVRRVKHLGHKRVFAAEVGCVHGPARRLVRSVDPGHAFSYIAHAVPPFFPLLYPQRRPGARHLPPLTRRTGAAYTWCSKFDRRCGAWRNME